MARYDLDYDTGYGLDYRRARRADSRRHFGRERHPESRWLGRERGQDRHESRRHRLRHRDREVPGYGRDLSGWTDFGAYDEAFDASVGYPGEYRKSRWQTDYGDPFHDRERDTPLRMIHDELEEYDEGFTRPGRGYTYGEDFGYGHRGYVSSERQRYPRRERERWRSARRGTERGLGGYGADYNPYGVEYWDW